MPRFGQNPFFDALRRQKQCYDAAEIMRLFQGVSEERIHRQDSHLSG
jgi:hypothetical protein